MSSVDQLEAGGGEESVTSGAEDKPMVGDDTVAALVTEDKDDKENTDKVMKAMVECVCVCVCVCGVCVCVCVCVECVGCVEWVCQCVWSIFNQSSDYV